MRTTRFKGESQSYKEKAKSMCPREKIREDSKDNGTGRSRNLQGRGCNGVQEETEEEQNQEQEEVGGGR